MTALLLYGDAPKNPEVRHELSEAVADPVVFLEHEGVRTVVASALEQARLEKREDVLDQVFTWHDFGDDDLAKDDSFPRALIAAELVLRVLGKIGVTSVVVPGRFPALVCDYLRKAGIDVTIDEELWSTRRRRKSPQELEGIERAQRAAETAMLAALRMLRAAEPTGTQDALRFEGEILTAELIRDAMISTLAQQGADSDEIIVQSGDAFLGGHEAGSGPILPDRTVIIDCFPRDRRTGAFSDMTRTFVPGTPSDEVRALHKHCLTALDIAIKAVLPGRDDVYQQVVDYFESNGFATSHTHSGSDPLREGFFHGLGHGVGLEVHERPRLGTRPDALVEGDVIAIEPGLYYRGVGGVRLEDTVVVTDQGAERFTDPFPYDLEV